MRIRKLREEAILPRYASSGAAGLDLCAAIARPLTIGANQRALVPTGVALELPAGHEGQVRPRSGLASKHGVTVLNAPGTIDEDYRGEVGVVLINHSDVAYDVAPGERIAQLVVAPVTRVSPEWLATGDALTTTERGEGGFGSTGRD